MKDYNKYPPGEINWVLLFTVGGCLLFWALVVTFCAWMITG